MNLMDVLSVLLKNQSLSVDITLTKGTDFFVVNPLKLISARYRQEGYKVQDFLI